MLPLLLHLACEIENHVVMKCGHLFDGSGIVQLLNIEITHTESAFRLETVLDADSGNECGSNYAVVAHIEQRIPGKSSDAVVVQEAALLNVLADPVYVSVAYVVEKLQLLIQGTVNAAGFTFGLFVFVPVL